MTPFEETIAQINTQLNTKINEKYSKIKVQGCHRPGNTQFVFTIFDNKNNYSMEFSTLKNMRMFKSDGDLVVETENINKIIGNISVLNNYINF